jgi:hypothetical protein
LSKVSEEKQFTYQFLQDYCSTLDEISIYLHKDDPVCQLIKESLESAYSVDTIYEKLIFVRQQIEINFLIEKNYNDDFYNHLKNFVYSDLSLLMDMFNLFFNKLMTAVDEKVFIKEKWEDINPVTLFGASYFLLKMNMKSLKNNISKYFKTGFEENIGLKVADDSNEIWKIDNMKYKEFNSIINNMSKYAQEILDDSQTEHVDDKLLKLQISEIIKNAIRHGNELTESKIVKAWYQKDSRIWKNGMLLTKNGWISLKSRIFKTY